MPAASMKVLHSATPDYVKELKKEILAAVGDMSGIEVWGQEVLVAPYMTSATTASGFWVGEKAQNEDKWQAKSFLVLKLGDKVEAAAKSNGTKVPKVGDWYYGFPSEHDMLSICGPGSKNAVIITPNKVEVPKREFSGWPCRLVLVKDIRGRTERPQDVM